MPNNLEALLKNIKEGLLSLYGHRLRGVYLYGSYARGDYDEESDYDVLVVLDDFTSYAAEIDLSAELISTLSLQYSVTISQVLLREIDWLTGDTPFLRNVRDEARAASI